MNEDTKEIAPRPLNATDALVNKDSFAADLGRWNQLIKSRALPSHIKTPEMALTIARMGEQYGWDPMRALRAIHLIDGRPELSAEAMLGLVREKCPDAVIMPKHHSQEKVIVSVLRPPMTEPAEVEVNIKDFKHLASRTNWKNYPGDMLWARCISRVCRRFFSDVTHGAYTNGELEEAKVTQVEDANPMRSNILDTLDEPVLAEVMEEE